MALIKKKIYFKKNINFIFDINKFENSAAGYSYYYNYYQMIRKFGYTASYFDIKNIKRKLSKSKKNILFLQQHNLNYIDELLILKKDYNFRIGIPAELENIVLKNKNIFLGKKNLIDFYYAWHNPNFINNSKMYSSYKLSKKPIISLEPAFNFFNFNKYFNTKKKYHFVYFASLNLLKFDRFSKFFSKILRNYMGIIDGPNWMHSSNSNFDNKLQSKIYSESLIGLNLSIDFQIKNNSELNERTYILAGLGIPQLIDNPKLLSDVYPEGLIQSASNASEFFFLFKKMINNYNFFLKKSKLAMIYTFKNHTYYERVNFLIKQMDTYL
ncbi:hypothetical protein ABXT57_02895 [Methylophilaceae bacterium Uisw_097]